MKKNIFKAAVIGCGKIGTLENLYNSKVWPGTHAAAFAADKHFRLVALVDNDRQKLGFLKKNYPQATFYSDIDLMLRENAPDIVSIATPTKFHFDSVIKVSKYKCPVILCEKPIAYDINEAKKMISACERNGTQMFINHQRHFDLLLQKWALKVNNRLIGRIDQGNIYYYNGFFNSGTHLFDLVRMFLGNPIAVSGNYNKVTSNMPNDDNIDGTIYFKDNLKVSVHSLSKNYGYFGMRLFGETGMLNITNLGFTVEYNKKVKSQNFKGYYQLSSRTIREGQPRSFIAETMNYLAKYLQGQVKPISTGEDGLAVLRLVAAFKESAVKTGRLITIKNN